MNRDAIMQRNTSEDVKGIILIKLSYFKPKHMFGDPVEPYQYETTLVSIQDISLTNE